MIIEKIITTTKECEVDIENIDLLTLVEALSIDNKIRNIGCWWWLRSPGDLSITACSFTTSATRARTTTPLYVDDDTIAVRPALRIRNLESSLAIGDKFDLAGYTWTVINQNTALCNETVGRTCFRKDWEAPDANDYDASDVKKWIAKWAEENGIKVTGGSWR